MAETELVALLRKAHAGERAAAIAYRGHRLILRAADERTAIRTIEDDEWRHRRELAGILRGFGGRPSRVRETAMLLIGITVFAGCFICRRFLATFFAAMLETANIGEYESAADLSAVLGRPDLELGFRAMAETEADHERVLFGMIEDDSRFDALAALFRIKRIAQTESGVS